MRRLFPAIALFGATLPLAHAVDSPAQLVVGERSIEELLRLPDKLEHARYEVQCEAFLDRTGGARYVRCYSMSNRPSPASLQKAVAYATRISRFQPATRNGEPVDVWAVLMVIVDTRLHEPLILAVPNNGVETARFGLLYTAPQRYHYTFVARPRGRPHKDEMAVVWAEFQIDEHGAIQDFTLSNEPDVSDEWVARVRAAAPEFKFIPGHYEGKPVAMHYVEPLTWTH
jgi:hypothetical protein